jgi:PST family polysaccharide transporter
MGAGLVGALVQLWIRIEVGNTLGTQALGQFQAAWVISMQYISVVLGAMAADYYPRLTSLIDDHKAASQLVNDQTEIALLISAPLFIGMMGLAPWVIHLLYSSAFAPAVEVLRWQVLGDVFKVASWPLGFIILAAGDGKTFFWVEALAFLVMGGLISCFSESVGLPITGIAFFVMYVVSLPLLYWLSMRRIGFYWQRSVAILFLSILTLCALVFAVSSANSWGGVIAVGLAFLSIVYAVVRLANMSGSSGYLHRFSTEGLQTINKLVRKMANH